MLAVYLPRRHLSGVDERFGSCADPTVTTPQHNDVTLRLSNCQFWIPGFERSQQHISMASSWEMTDIQLAPSTNWMLRV